MNTRTSNHATPAALQPGKRRTAHRRSARRLIDDEQVPDMKPAPTLVPPSVRFNAVQADLLEEAAHAVARAGGPQAAGAAAVAARWASKLAASLDEGQRHMAEAFARGELPLLEFRGLRALPEAPLPEHLPPLAELESDADCGHIAARIDVLLVLCSQRPFAFDIDNAGKLVRLVGNFRGGGSQRLNGEPAVITELSSHTGRALGRHTEATYWCSQQARDGHSPAPSSLALAARYNPLGEPTTVVPLDTPLDRVGTATALALTLPVFDFSASDSFTAAHASGGQGVSILETDPQGGPMVRFNEYRFRAGSAAPEAAHRALRRLREEIARAPCAQLVLNAENAVLINNVTALHCRDVVRDNRRLLIRLFGYADSAKPIELSGDPLIVKG